MLLRTLATASGQVRTRCVIREQIDDGPRQALDVIFTDPRTQVTHVLRQP
jgi:hypothetical protein